MKNIFSFVLICLLINVRFFAQENTYSLLQLTGQGNLQLKGTLHKLQPKAYTAFLKMKEAAKKEGIGIEMLSGYRSLKRQKEIWNRKYKRFIENGLAPQEAIDKIVEYSTLPGTSRHHWGTDIDIIDNKVKSPKKHLLTENYERGGVYFKLKKWMDYNAEKFGFYLVYTNEKGRKGFKYEPWHYTYKPISKKMYVEFKKIDIYTLVRNLSIEGNRYLSKDFLNKYVKNNLSDINEKLHD